MITIIAFSISVSYAIFLVYKKLRNNSKQTMERLYQLGSVVFLFCLVMLQTAENVIEFISKFLK
jgi:hypothetical protein